MPNYEENLRNRILILYKAYKEESEINLTLLDQQEERLSLSDLSLFLSNYKALITLRILIDHYNRNFLDQELSELEKELNMNIEYRERIFSAIFDVFLHTVK